jgi:hypothetical protein
VNRLPSCPSPYSLAWGILALVAYLRNDTTAGVLEQFATSLTALVERRSPDDVCTLAVCALGLDAAEGDNVFEV